MEDIISRIKKNPYDEVQDLSISELVDIIQYSRDKFFNSESVISDNIYDLIIDFLTFKDPKNKILKEIGFKVDDKKKVKLDYYLGSMDKIKPPSNKLEKWLMDYKSPYILSEKLDGVSALLIYKKNGEIKLFTRGTATHGIDISQILKYLPRIPTYEKMLDYTKKFKLKTRKDDNLISFRGELIISKKEFDEKWKSTKSNARNTVSGLVNSKKIDPTLANSTSLVLYEMVDPNLKLLEQLKYISQMDFKTVHYKDFKKIDFETLSSYLVKRKDKSKYIIDGIIVSNNELHNKNEKGNPDYAFAFKDILEDQKAVTEILDIEWNVSKDGYINPTVIIKPVEIGGVNINRVTAYNAKYVVDNNLGKGAKIELIRSGDVIPKITKVLKPSKTPDLPKGKWKWNETKVDIITCNMNCREIDIKNIHYFFSTLDTKGMGQKIVEKIYDSGLKTIPDILKAKTDDFLKVDGFKEKSASNLVDSIKNALTNESNGVNLYDIMKASNKLGHGMGGERSKLILEKYPNLFNEYKKWSKNEFINKLKEIPGFEDKTSQQFVENFDSFMKFFKSIEKYIKLKKIIIVKKKKSSLNGKILVLSGFRDKDLEKLLETIDVKVSNSVSKNTNILVVKDKSVMDEETGKVKKALELGIKIITKDDLLKLTST